MLLKLRCFGLHDIKLYGTVNIIFEYAIVIIEKKSEWGLGR